MRYIYVHTRKSIKFLSRFLIFLKILQLIART